MSKSHDTICIAIFNKKDMKNWEKYIYFVHFKVQLFYQMHFESSKLRAATRVGHRLNFIDSAYRFRFFSIPSFDSNVIK